MDARQQMRRMGYESNRYLHKLFASEFLFVCAEVQTPDNAIDFTAA